MATRFSDFIKSERGLLTLMCLVTTALIFLMMDLNSINPDETTYLFVGKSILEGEYPFNFVHRLPLVPSIMSACLFMGLGTHIARLAIPLIFMNLLLISTYFLARELHSKKAAVFSVLALFTFPFFWRWGLSILVDIPLAALSTLFILFFYKGVEKERKYLMVSGVFLALAFLTKTLAVFLVAAAIAYIIYRKKWRIVLEKEFIYGIAIAIIIMAAVYASFSLATSASADISREVGLHMILSPDFADILKLALAPILLLGIFGISRKKESMILLLPCIFLVLGFVVQGRLKERYMAMLYPLFCILVSMGYLRLRKVFNRRRIIDIVFIVLLLVSFMNTLYLSGLEETAQWGAEGLSDYLNTLEPGTVLTEYLPEYLQASTSHRVMAVPAYYVVGSHSAVTSDEYFDILSNVSHPLYKEFADSRKSGNFETIREFDDDFIRDGGVDYVILSIYTEWGRVPDNDAYFHPAFGPIEITIIKRPYSNGRVPPDYRFSSELFQRMENSTAYRLKEKIYRGDQEVFLIYEVI